MQRNNYPVLNFVQSQNDVGVKTKHQQNIEPSLNPFFRNWKFWVIIVALISTVIIAGLRYEDVVEYGEDGKPVLTSIRAEELDRDTLRFYENVEQYALIVRKSGYYPCLNCHGQDSIFLFQGEVWKYGTTINGKLGRYGSKLPHPMLIYVVQMRGDWTTCKAREKHQIYHYPLLPENQKRKTDEKLVRPPGNPYHA